MEGSLQGLLISSRSVNNHVRYMHILFLGGRFLSIISSETASTNISKYYRRYLWKFLCKISSFPHD